MTDVRLAVSDTIPAPVPLAEALSMREAKERELFEDDPAMSTSLFLHPASASAHVLNAQKDRGKSRNINGPERKNGTVLADERERRPENRAQHSRNDIIINGAFDVDRRGIWEERADGHNPPRYSLDQTRSIDNLGVVSISTRPPPPSNGHSSDPSRSGTITPAQSREGAFGSHSPPRHSHNSRNSPFIPQEESWTGQYAGPASGFLQGPGGPFGRVAQNPGRTIYSQQHRAD